jgi:hypothetical protein
MRETPDDLQHLDALLHASYRDAGEHLRSVVTPERRVPAAVLAARLTGVRVLALATVTAAGRPLVAPVDGLFYRGTFWFGSSPSSVRMRHLAVRPYVSATYVEGERFGVIVHGRAAVADLGDPEHRGFRDLCLEVYGEAWNDWGAGASYASIEADRIFAFAFEHEGGPPG